MMLPPFNPPSAWTPSKSVVRERVDEPLIAATRNDALRPLTYFGLPAEGEDLRAWSLHINVAYAVDRDAGKLRRLADNMLVHCPTIAIYERLGEIENLILDGSVDLNGQALRNEWDTKARAWRWAYDLVNLDAYGIFLHGRTHVEGRRAVYYKRAEALKRLFALQKGHSFILLITVPLKASNPQTVRILTADLDSYLDQKRRILDARLANAASPISNELFGGPLTSYLLTAAPLLLAEYSAIESIQMTQCLVLTYAGNKGAPMLHIACRFEDTGNALPTTDSWEVALKAPYLKVRTLGDAPALQLSKHQSPISNEKEIRESLAKMGIRLDE